MRLQETRLRDHDTERLAVLAASGARCASFEVVVLMRRSPQSGRCPQPNGERPRVSGPWKLATPEWLARFPARASPRPADAWPFAVDRIPRVPRRNCPDINEAQRGRGRAACPI